MTIYDCPILDFQWTLETGDYSKLGGQEVFEKLNSEIIDEFGLTEINQVIYHKIKSLVRLQSKRGYTEDSSLDIHIEIAEQELKNLISKCQIKDNIRQIHARNHRILSKWSGRDSTKLTVFYYYNDLRDLEKENVNKDRQRYTTSTGYDRSSPKGHR